MSMKLDIVTTTLQLLLHLIHVDCTNHTFIYFDVFALNPLINYLCGYGLMLMSLEIVIQPYN